MHLKTFLLHQKEEIEKYKWIQSQKAGKDLGNAAVTEWVQKFGAQYRQSYEFILNQLIHDTAQNCKIKLKDKIPEVNDELWEIIFKEVINNFIDMWTKEVVCEKNPVKKNHLEEI